MLYQRSSALFREAQNVIPGGVNSPVRAFKAVGGTPIFAKSAKGAYVYDEDDYSETLKLVDETSEYALTGAVIATDRYAINEATMALQNSAGNFYINDKPTGAVVGQQPFGGARASGTNDKAGSALNLLRWVSPRMIKETFVTPTDYRYPFLG